MTNNMISSVIFSLIIIICISSCSVNTGRYHQKHDSFPTRHPTKSELQDAIPRKEKLSRGGNKDYTVKGKHYRVLTSAKHFSQTGIASWYGRKFHGHLTSNGEVYNMFAMSAAHKNLPLPSYVKVVNNNNGKSVIVRVNDRGPFHNNRIIDLSYSAAFKLDIIKKGTANVTITAITDIKQQNTKVTNNDPSVATYNKSVPSGKYIQVFASNKKKVAINTIDTLKVPYKNKAKIQKINGIYRVLIGPILKNKELITALASIKKNAYPKAFIKTITDKVKNDADSQ